MATSYTSSNQCAGRACEQCHKGKVEVLPRHQCTREEQGWRCQAQCNCNGRSGQTPRESECRRPGKQRYRTNNLEGPRPKQAKIIWSEDWRCGKHSHLDHAMPCEEQRWVPPVRP